jgi:hypothetical protein
MKPPELPEPFLWADGDKQNACHTIRRTGTPHADLRGSEEVAWARSPGRGNRVPADKWECVSAPAGVFGSNNWHYQPADTEEEAINLIISFALLEIRKDE